MRSNRKNYLPLMLKNMTAKKPLASFPKNILIITILVSVLVSSVIGFIAGSAAFELSNYVSQSPFLQRLLPDNIHRQGTAQEGNSKGVASGRTYDNREQQIINVVRKASPAVVSIIISKDLPIVEQYMADPFQGFEGSPFRDFFTPFNFKTPQYRQKGYKKQEIGGGTGFMVGKDGLILTNKHVVEDKDAEYTVLTNDGKKYKAEVIVRDPLQDLALIRAKGLKNISSLKLGDSDKLQIGQTAITIGNALGEFRNTVSVGVISGLKRTVTASSGFGGSSERLDQVIQTDAAINRGNSGGPLLNLQGEVVGVNTAMAAGAQNIGFAIPINFAKRMVKEIEQNGEISYPYLGVRYVLINKAIQEANHLSVDYGALIIRGQSVTNLAVIPGSPADKAGLRENDIILEVNGKKINENYSLSRAILSSEVGQTITLKVLSKGRTKTVKVTLEKMPSNYQ